MALAGIAFGAETLTLASDAKNSSNAKNDSYTVAADGTASLTGGNIMLNWTNDYTSLSSWEICFTMTVVRNNLSDQNLMKFENGTFFAINSNGTVEFYSGVTSSKNSDSAFVTTVNTPTTITLSFIANENIYTGDIVGGTLSAVSGDKTLSVEIDTGMALKDAATVLWTNSGKEQFSGITISKMDNNLVPEPTAATLSLLALASLAIRRRRK